MSSEREVPRRRLHPAEILLGALDNIREALIGIVVVIVLGAGGLNSAGAIALALAGILVAALVAWLRWSSTSYEVREGSLRFRTGLLSPDETAIPLGRVQGLDTAQGPVQRLFGVHQLHVQTAGGGAEGEIVLRAVSDARARELREATGLAELGSDRFAPGQAERSPGNDRFAPGQAGRSPPGALALPEWRLGAGGLIAAAATAPQFGVIAPLVGGAAAVLDDVFLEGPGRGLIDRLPQDASGVALVVVALAAAAWLLSFAGAVIAFGGFSVVRDGGRLRIRRGVLQHRAASLPLHRVHAVEVVEGVVRRPFGLATVRIQTAGYRDEPAAAQTLLPLVRTRDVDRMLGLLVPALEGALGELERPPARALRRYALPELAVGAAIGAAIALWASVPWAWAAVPLGALAGFVDGAGRHRSAGWRLDAGKLALRRRVLARRTLLARADRLQDQSLISSPFQRRAGLASLQVAVGSGRRSGVSHLEAIVASGLFERLRGSSAVSP